MITTAFIHLWGERVGAVAWDANTQTASFEYDPKFIVNNWEVAPLKMPLNQANQIFSFPDLVRNTTFKGLPGLLADVLPDKYGNQLINAWLVQNGRPENSLNPVELLCFIGTRGMGALEFEPVNFKSNQNSSKSTTHGKNFHTVFDWLCRHKLNKHERYYWEKNRNDQHLQS